MEHRTLAIDLLNCGWWADALIERAQLDREANERREAAGVPITVPHVVHHDAHELTAWERDWIRARIADAIGTHRDAHERGLKTIAQIDADRYVEQYVEGFVSRHLHASIVRSRELEHVREVERHEKTAQQQIDAKREEAEAAIAKGEAMSATTLDEAHALMVELVQDEIRSKHPAPVALATLEPDGATLEREAPSSVLALPVGEMETRCPSCRELRDRLFEYEEARFLCEPCCEREDEKRAHAAAAAIDAPAIEHDDE